MARGSYDFAVFGSTPLALLLAGLLVSAHGKTVCLIGDSWSPFRLPRRFDLALLPATRPETWAQLKSGTAEMTRVLNSVGKGLVERIDPLLIAEIPASIDALAHLRASATGLGFAAEKVVDRAIVEPGVACRLRDVPVLVHGRIEPALESWVDHVEVRRIPRENCRVTLRRDGVAKLRTGDVEFEAARTILADDEAILTLLGEAERDRVLRIVPARTVLTEPAKPLPTPHIRYLDRGVTLSQRGKSGITAIATGARDSAHARIGASLIPQGRVRRAGQADFSVVDTTDGAPLVGYARGSKATVIAGLGEAGAFFAPALARLLAGSATEAETLFFAPREPGRGNSRLAVADYVPEAAA